MSVSSKLGPVCKERARKQASRIKWQQKTKEKQSISGALENYSDPSVQTEGKSMKILSKAKLLLRRKKMVIKH